MWPQRGGWMHVLFPNMFLETGLHPSCIHQNPITKSCLHWTSLNHACKKQLHFCARSDDMHHCTFAIRRHPSHSYVCANTQFGTVTHKIYTSPPAYTLFSRDKHMCGQILWGFGNDLLWLMFKWPVHDVAHEDVILVLCWLDIVAAAPNVAATRLTLASPASDRGCCRSILYIHIYIYILFIYVYIYIHI